MEGEFAGGTKSLKYTLGEFKVHQVQQQQVLLSCIVYHNRTFPAPAALLCGLLLQAAGRAAEQVVSKKFFGYHSSPELKAHCTAGKDSKGAFHSCLVSIWLLN